MLDLTRKSWLVVFNNNHGHRDINKMEKVKIMTETNLKTHMTMNNSNINAWKLFAMLKRLYYTITVCYRYHHKNVHKVCRTDIAMATGDSARLRTAHASSVEPRVSQTGSVTNFFHREVPSRRALSRRALRQIVPPPRGSSATATRREEPTRRRQRHSRFHISGVAESDALSL